MSWRKPGLLLRILSSLSPPPPQGFIRPGQPCVTTTFAFIMKPAQAQRANGEHQDRFEFMHVPTNTPDLQHRLSEIFLHHEEHK